MAQPIVEYYSQDGSTKVTNWNIGEIDANTVSPTLHVSVWNNKGGTTDVSHMKDVSVTCLDGTGGDTDTMIADAWMQVSVNGATAAAIGGTTSKPVTAVGLNPNVDGHVIYGTTNDGSVANSKKNFANMDFAVKVPPNALEGLHNFKIRTQYFYT